MNKQLPALFAIPTAVFAIILVTLNNAVAQDRTADYQAAYYQVTELNDGDHLNVRAGPTAESEDIGDLQSGSKPYEILETDPTGEWGRIIWLEGNGWVALRFMQPIQVELLSNTQIPVGLTCVGAKPFWTLEFTSQDVGVLSTQEAVKEMTVANTAVSRNGNQFPVAVELQTNNNTATTTLRRAQCSDGMGGLRYEWAADIVVNPQFAVLSGCCVLR